MTKESQPDTDTEEHLTALVARIKDASGQALVVELPPTVDTQTLIDRLRWSLNLDDDVQVKIVLGSASTTAEKAI